MGRRRFRSAFNLERWADNQVDRINRAHNVVHRGQLLADLVGTIWRDGYRCGAGDATERALERLGLAELADGEPPVEPWQGAERLQRRRVSDP